ncbi:MAG TPA: hypothetical protein VF624_01850 [Tepidisphaeraceae bacterium]|jgi:hypothetical protein
MSEAISFIETTERGADQNAWRHGMYARKVLLEGEQRGAFEQLREALVEQWRPRNVTEWMLVDQLAKQHWRLMRAGDAEADKLGQLSSIDPRRPMMAAKTLEAAIGLDVGRDDSSLARLQVFQMRLERSVLRIINQLLTLRKMRRKMGSLRDGRGGKNPAQALARQGDRRIGELENSRNENPAAGREVDGVIDGAVAEAAGQSVDRAVGGEGVWG